MDFLGITSTSPSRRATVLSDRSVSWTRPPPVQRGGQCAGRARLPCRRRTGNALGSAQLFPLLPAAGGSTKAVDSWSYQLVAGADLTSAGGRPDPNPMSTMIASEATLTVAGQNVYGYSATAGSVGFADTLDLGVTNADGGTQTVTADQWEQAFIAANPGVNPNAYTTIDFSSAPSSCDRKYCRWQPNFMTREHESVAARRQRQADDGSDHDPRAGCGVHGDGLGELCPDLDRLQSAQEVCGCPSRRSMPPPPRSSARERVTFSLPPRRTLISATAPRRRRSPAKDRSSTLPGQDQLGGAAVYTAGHLASLGIETAVNVTTGQSVEVDLAANEITGDNIATVSPEAYDYGIPFTTSVPGSF